MNSNRRNGPAQALVVLAALCFLGASTAEAQNFLAKPVWGTKKLDGEFFPKTFKLILLTVGGKIKSKEDEGGYVQERPHVKIIYNGKRALKIWVESPHDTTLLVCAPGVGNWHANDDSGGSRNPRLELPKQAGHYEIWVGNFEKGAELAKGTTLYVQY